MAGDVLLDTNIVIALFATEPAVDQRVLSRARSLHTPSRSWRTLFWCHKSTLITSEPEESRRLGGPHRLCSSCDLRHRQTLRPDQTAASTTRERQFPDNDVWIAAVALQHDFPLLTSDGHLAFSMPNC